MNNYIPSPVNTDDVKLDPELISLTEMIAENVHDVWALGRINDGWVYGENRDDEKKTTPCLVPYAKLPETEKEYDRKTAFETVKLIKKLGFRITRENLEAFFKEQGDCEKAEEMFQRAFELCQKAEPNKDFDPDLATTCFNYGIFREKVGYLDKALEIAKATPDNPFCKAIIEIYGERNKN